MSACETPTRAEIEDFLFGEAELLDAWDLTEWRALFTDDCRYLVPTPNADPYASPDSTLHIIADDAFLLTERVKRLSKRTAHAEFPHSKTQRLVSNVRIVANSSDEIHVRSVFATFRSRHGRVDTYYGRHEHILVVEAGALKIKQKRSILGMEALRPQGSLSIIV
ncbi:p-cumate 2,3-dioxygenase beta subunit [Sphingopyxis panaciterrae]|uniref:aromatic-ring-hydroxylating dioxygenase subunit beta n=1 Tax=Sphingopyxis panaciterrae TaxID=363841 RepID=UPI0031334D90|nr:p-cumate 2,3-dioxygenase beta subunit [Sphingopyxis panaciterrae]